MRSGKLVRFAMLADVQYAEKSADGARHYALSKNRLGECVAAVNALRPPPAFVIQLGDLIDGGAAAGAELAAAAAVVNRLFVPRYHVLGNHDFVGLGREQTMAILQMERAYYAFDLNGWRFVVLDTQDVAVQGGWDQGSEPYQAGRQWLRRLSERGAENAQPYNGALGDRQLDWLMAVLDEAEQETLPVIVFGHQPLVPAGDKHTLWNAEQVVAILQRRGCVKAYICGHRHRDGCIQQNGVYYVALEAMVECAKQAAVWYYVSLRSDVIDIKGFGIARQRTLAIR